MKYKVRPAIFHFVKLHAAIFPRPIRTRMETSSFPMMLPEIETLFLRMLGFHSGFLLLVSSDEEKQM